jgi:hypothetical protein
MDRSPQLPELDDMILRANETHSRTEDLLVRTRRIGQDLMARVGRLLEKEPAMSEQALAEKKPALPLARRREIFAALVEAQDREMPVVESRMAVAALFGVSENQVQQIETEGVDHTWPPLDDAE